MPSASSNEPFSIKYSLDFFSYAMLLLLLLLLVWYCVCAWYISWFVTLLPMCIMYVYIDVPLHCDTVHLIGMTHIYVNCKHSVWWRFVHIVNMGKWLMNTCASDDSLQFTQIYLSVWINNIHHCIACGMRACMPCQFECKLCWKLWNQFDEKPHAFPRNIVIHKTTKRQNHNNDQIEWFATNVHHWNI